MERFSIIPIARKEKEMKKFQKIALGNKMEIFIPDNWNYFFQCSAEKARCAYVLIRDEKNCIPLVFFCSEEKHPAEIEFIQSCSPRVKK